MAEGLKCEDVACEQVQMPREFEAAPESDHEFVPETRPSTFPLSPADTAVETFGERSARALAVTDPPLADEPRAGVEPGEGDPGEDGEPGDEPELEAPGVPPPAPAAGPAVPEPGEGPPDGGGDPANEPGAQ